MKSYEDLSEVIHLLFCLVFWVFLIVLAESPIPQTESLNMS